MAATIAALCTAPAPAGLGVIRLSGDRAVVVAAQVFRPVRPAVPLAEMPPYTAAFGYAHDTQGDIDECVALVFRAPHSYTGEDVVELSCHGGPYLLQRLLRATIAAGARPAEAGEYTRRAFLNGKIDLTRAEAVMDLIAANGELAAKAALAAREGALYRRLEAVRASLLGVNAQFAAYVDYPDEDIPELSPGELGAALDTAAAALTALLDTYDAGRLLREGIDTVIVGSPNVGKSTLMNRLAGCERSIVTPLAGTTRDVIEETVRLGDMILCLADTAGLQETAEPVEAIGVQRARDRMARAALLLVVFDGARPLSDADRVLARQARGGAAIAVVNKADQPSKIDKEYIFQQFQHVVYLSAQEGTGFAALEDAIRQVCGIYPLDAGAPMLANERQRDGVRRCLAAVKEARTALTAGMTLDAVSVGVDEALAALLELTGERVTEAVVDEVFARFCVGK